jgi:hypothetical protein
MQVQVLQLRKVAESLLAQLKQRLMQIVKGLWGQLRTALSEQQSLYRKALVYIASNN